MMLNDEVSDSIESYLAYDDLLITFNDLFDECKLVRQKYKMLKKEHASLASDFDRLKFEHNDSLAPYIKCDELEMLKKKNLQLHEILEKFEIGSKSLNMILASKNHVYRRDGIGL